MTDESQIGSTGSAPQRKSSIGVTIFMWLLAIGFLAAGYGAMKTYFDERAEIADLEENGVATEASVISVTETTNFRGGGGITLSISYPTPDGPDLVHVADVTVCTEADYEDGTETVDIVYAANDPEAVRLADCAATVDTYLPLAIGIVFGLLGLFLAWSLIRKPRSASNAAPG